jgi:hypothetical protein
MYYEKKDETLEIDKLNNNSITLSNHRYTHN